MRKRFCFLFFLALIFAYSLIYSGKIHALESIFYPQRDTYVKPGGNESHGFETTLRIESVETPNADYRSYAFIIFDISALPKNTIIDKGILSLALVEDQSDNCSVQIQRQGDSWNEYENYFSLGYGNTGTIYDIAYIVNVGTYNWDVTQLVSEWLGAKFPNYGVVMFATDECQKLFASRHHENQDLWPKLTVSYHLPPTATPTPSPIPTPTPTIKPTATPTLKPTVNLTPSPSLIFSPTFSPTPPPLPNQEEKRQRSQTSIIIFLALTLGTLGTTAFFFWKRKIKKVENVQEPEKNQPVENPKDINQSP